MYPIFEILRFAIESPIPLSYILLAILAASIVLLVLARRNDRRWLWISAFALEGIAEAVSIAFLVAAREADDLLSYCASVSGIVIFAILIFVTLVLMVNKPEKAAQ